MIDPRLSTNQSAIVRHDSGALLVVAGPGSGKTRVLTARVRRLVTEVKGHFRVLALTFTNKAANEMQERLHDLPNLKQRAFIGTLHGFCLEMLTDRGKPVGVTSDAQIFESFSDRKQILLEAVLADPLLHEELNQATDEKARNRKLDDWLKAIATVKAHPVSQADIEDPLVERILDAYDSGLRATGAYDFDDLLLLAYRLLNEVPQVAAFYRRLYQYICVDEAQDLNEAQYSVLRSLCGDDFRNVMMVGDPKQSIYGFNTSSPKYMEQFAEEFEAQRIELTENYRSSREVVAAAQALDPNYRVEGQLPVKGLTKIWSAEDEVDEASKIAQLINHLGNTGHPDVEGKIDPSRCAILGRTRFALLNVEKALTDVKIPFFKRLSATHQNESQTVEDFVLGLRVACNPKDRLHLGTLAKRWKAPAVDLPAQSTPIQVAEALRGMATSAAQASIVPEALQTLVRHADRLDMVSAVSQLRDSANQLDSVERQAIYQDTEVLLQEWDSYLRMGGKKTSIATFISSMALGTTQQPNRDGVALLTVHSSKGLEFDVVFIVGMAEGSFPDYRARGNASALQEEKRNAFVAVTRSKRLLFLSYARRRTMPWGEVWDQSPSPFLRLIAK